MTLAPMLRNGLMASVLMLAAGAAPAALLELVVDGAGQLTGARNVVVNGTAYEVSFDNGACAAVFDSCTWADWTPSPTNLVPDPACRRCWPWGQQRSAVRDFTRAADACRLAHAKG